MFVSETGVWFPWRGDSGLGATDFPITGVQFHLEAGSIANLTSNLGVLSIVTVPHTADPLYKTATLGTVFTGCYREGAITGR